MAAVRTVLTLAVIALSAVGFAACRGGDGEATPTPPAPTATTSASPSPATSQLTETPSVALEDEVAEAYLAYWQAYADAVLNLDIAFVHGFAAGEELERIQDQIDELRAGGFAARLVIEHDFAVVSVEGRDAVVIDEFVNNSFLVDAASREPTEGEGSGQVSRDTFYLAQTDGRWVVMRSTRDPS